jgi:hypothetical protein
MLLPGLCSVLFASLIMGHPVDEFARGLSQDRGVLTIMAVGFFIGVVGVALITLAIRRRIRSRRS